MQLHGSFISFKYPLPRVIPICTAYSWYTPGILSSSSFNVDAAGDLLLRLLCENECELVINKLSPEVALQKIKGHRQA